MFGPERVTELPYPSPFSCPAESATPFLCTALYGAQISVTCVN